MKTLSNLDYINLLGKIRQRAFDASATSLIDYIDGQIDAIRMMDDKPINGVPGQDNTIPLNLVSDGSTVATITPAIMPKPTPTPRFRGADMA
jgi:hypothetical protein